MNKFKDVTDSIGGFRFGELAAFSVGRQTGKSMYYNQNLHQEILLEGQRIVMKILKNRLYDGQEIVLPPMTKPKYQFSRAKWYLAEFDENYYHEVRAWCSQQFGPHPTRPDAWSRWQHRYVNKIQFAYEKDYVLFTLRWS